MSTPPSPLHSEFPCVVFGEEAGDRYKSETLEPQKDNGEARKEGGQGGREPGWVVLLTLS